MDLPLPENLLAEIHAQARQDPGVPRTNPTTAFWQMPPHSTLSDVQSPALQKTTDVAVIGSGITGCSVVSNLLSLGAASPSASSPSTITVFEARQLTSGATGRNGGLLSNFVPGDFTSLSARFGHEQAAKVARFANRTLEKMHALAGSTDEFQSVSEVRRLLDIILLADEEALDGAKKSLALYEEHVPEDRGKAMFYTPAEAEEHFSVKAAGGVLTYPNGAFWPYRLITAIWNKLYQSNAGRLCIETNTPVQALTYELATSAEYPYVLCTPRGYMRAKKVVYATNGFSGHLLPQLRGCIFPLRGTMSTQKATPEFGRHGDRFAWSMAGGAHYDADTQCINVGVYYASQNSKTGDIFIGGEKARINELLVSDDTTIGAPCVENLSTVLPRYFTKGWKEGQRPGIRKIWSGIMGFTADRVPIVGTLPSSITQRGPEGGEWIAAGFNGYGMPLCWSCGEAVAKMILGLPVDDFLPEVFLPTEKRLKETRQNSSAHINQFFSGSLS